MNSFHPFTNKDFMQYNGLLVNMGTSCPHKILKLIYYFFFLLFIIFSLNSFSSYSFSFLRVLRGGDCEQFEGENNH